ncbi:MAG: hypothetical protein OEY37_05280 [Gammaproteobacteria bacterium]|nr:hypothetical protein [Gammaproteobacteria bacterium]MDH5619130.1 hypothetical protein [Gammaproteobacteria bacterium]
MKAQTTISILVAAALALTASTATAQGRQGQGGASAQQRAQVERGQRDVDRDRMRDRDRVNDPAQDRKRDRDQDRTNAPDTPQAENRNIYGSELMSEQERNQYREQLRLTESDPEQRTRFMAEHQEKMQKRAKEKGVELPDPPADGQED